MAEIKVTVLCLAYNHEEWIRDALEGFVCQQADFSFEVIVHDDASTDGTPGIIREYAAKYPDIIKPVFEVENLHSHGVNIARTVLYPLVRGEYTALCEGDDCWTDPMKLALQLAALEAAPESDICACAARVLLRRHRRGFVAPKTRDCIIPAGDVIKGGGAYVATCTLLCRSGVYLNPAPFRDELFNDYSLQIQGALRGGMVWLSRCMAVRRLGVAQSWTSSHRGVKKVERHVFNRRMLLSLDSETNGKYHADICRRLEFYDSEDMVLQGHYAALLHPARLAVTAARLRRLAVKIWNNVYYTFKYLA